jgi:uncharacterized membrane protein
MKRLKTLLFWLLGLTFIVIGLLKYIDVDEVTKPVFDRANFPPWFFYVVGTVETLGGILLLLTASASRRIGSILIAIVMLGAMGTRYMLKEPFSHLIVPAAIFAVAVFMSLDVERRSR